MITGANYGSMTQNQYGLGYRDTKALCLDIVRDELTKYHSEALLEAKKRNETLLTSIVQKLKEKNMDDATALEEFKNPAMQFDYLEAQKAYMKAGTPELKKMLSDIIVTRISISERSLLQISLGDAVQIAPRLISAQMATLALIFVVSCPYHIPFYSHSSFANHLKKHILPIFFDGISRKKSELQQLIFTGCSQRTNIEIPMIRLFKKHYPGLFSSGYDKDELFKGDVLFPQQDLFMPCINDPSRFQISAITEDELTELLNNTYLSAKRKADLQSKFSSNLLSDESAMELVKKLVPEITEVFEYWDKSELRYSVLSPVGIIIGAQYAHQITGEDYDLAKLI